MKDLYSFHVSEEDLKRYYEESKKAYMAVYERLGLGADTRIVLASGGDFTKDYSHEFQFICDTGEDTIFNVKSQNLAFNREIAPSQAPAYAYETEPKSREDVFGEHITGMEALVNYLHLPMEKCIKTLLYEADEGRVIAAAVRGDYEVNELKLKKVAGVGRLSLARGEVVKRVTGAELGYAGIIGLPAEVAVYVDDALAAAVNFECGANKTNYHSINLNWGRDLPKPDNFYDLKVAKEGDLHPETGEVYEVYKGSEVGNIFPLNVKFSTAFGYTFTDKDGQEKPVYMGSYGIGTTRLMGVIVEKYHDDNGMIWPEPVAPYQVHLISLGESAGRGEEIYTMLGEQGVEVLWDDREESPGVKFADADLIGIPVRLVVSSRTGDKIEWKRRDQKESELLTVDEVLGRLK